MASKVPNLLEIPSVPSSSKVSDRIEAFDRTKTIDAIITSPHRIQRELKSLSATGLLTRFPLATVLLCIIMTILLGAESGMNDCRDGWDRDDWWGSSCRTGIFIECQWRFGSISSSR